MAAVKRSLVVMDQRSEVFCNKGKEFKVIKVINSTNYEIGQELSKHAVDQIIHGGTQVTVVPYKR